MVPTVSTRTSNLTSFIFVLYVVASPVPIHAYLSIVSTLADDSGCAVCQCFHVGTHELCNLGGCHSFIRPAGRIADYIRLYQPEVYDCAVVNHSTDLWNPLNTSCFALNILLDDITFDPNERRRALGLNIDLDTSLHMHSNALAF